jgi:hypothetical protein
MTFKNQLLSKSFDSILPRTRNDQLDLTPGRNQPPCDIKDVTLQLPLRAQEIIAKADPSALVERMLPSGVISSEARYIAACFWAWLCVIDGQSSQVRNLLSS